MNKNKMKGLFFGILVTALLALAFPLVSAQAFQIVDVDVNGVDVFPDDLVLEVERGERLNVKVELEAFEDEDAVSIEAEIKGVEKREDVDDETDLFDVRANRTYVKFLTLTVPQDIEIDEDGFAKDFRLRITAESSDEEDIESIPLSVARSRHGFELLNVDFAQEVEAGSNMLVEVVVKNRGSEREDDVFAKIVIPELNVVKQAFLGDLTPVDEDDDEEDAAEESILVKIPSGAETGSYVMQVIVYNKDARVEEEFTLTVLGRGEVVPTQERRTLVAVDEALKQVSRGEGAIYRIALTNLGTKEQFYTVELSGTETFATSRVDPAILSLQPGDSGTLSVFVLPTNTAVSGEHVFTATVKSDGSTIKQVQLTTDVTSGVGAVDLRSNLVVIAIILGAILIVLIVVLIVTRRPGKDNEKYY